MKLTIERDALVTAAGAVRAVAETKSTIPILTHALLEASAQDGLGRLMLGATNLTMALRVQAPAEVNRPGRTTLPADMLFQIARTAPLGSQIAIELDGGQARLRTGRARYTLGTLPAEDFPSLGRDLPDSFELPAEVLRNLLGGTRFAVCRDDSRFWLAGVYLHVADGRLFAVATDGSRLARLDVPAPDGVEISGVIVPDETVDTLLKMLEGVQGNVTVSLGDERTARFVIGDSVLTTKLVDGQYPDYQNVIPADLPHVATIDVEPFCAALDRVMLACDKTNCVRFEFAKGRVVARAINADRGTWAEEEIEVDFDRTFVMGFNGRYLREQLSVLAADTVEIHISDPMGPVMLTVPGREGVMHLLMPMRV